MIHDDSILWENKLEEIDKRYPFGERKYWPYQQWLKARKKVKEIIAKNDPELAKRMLASKEKKQEKFNNLVGNIPANASWEEVERLLGER